MADSRKYSANLDLQGNSILNGGFEQVAALPLSGYDEQTISFRGKLYTWYNGKWNCVADDLGGVEETREEQFTFQPTANDESVKDGLAIVKNIKGNTVVANQLYKNVANSMNGITWTTEGNYIVGNGTATATSFSNINQVIFLSINHKYYCRGYGDFIEGVTLQVFTNDGNVVMDVNKIASPPKDSLYAARIRVDAGVTLDNVKFIIELIDLTKMFGAGNEPITIEDFERLYPNLPSKYNAGSLLNLNADAIKSVGFNLFDKSKITPNAIINNTTGGNYSFSNNFITDYIRVFPNTTYYAKNVGSERIRSHAFYDVNKSFIKSFTIPATTDIASGEFTTPSDAYYVRLSSYNTMLDSVCINLSHSGYRNGEYEPYKESIVNLPIQAYFPDGMKSAGVIKDEIVWDEGLKKYKAIKRVGSIDMGTLDWNLLPNYTDRFHTALLDGKRRYDYSTKENVLCVKYSTVGAYLASNSDKVIYRQNSLNDAQINIIDSSYTDVESFKQSLQGQILYYELETPVETIIDDYDLIDYEVSDFGTEEIIADEPTTPIVADIQYGFNAVDEIRNHRFEIRDLKKLISRGINLNGVNVKLGDTSTIPAYITYNDVLYPMRIQDNWLQIYRNGVWGNLFNLVSEVILSSYIEEFEGDWYNPNILEYILSDDLTIQLISGKLDFRSILSSIQGFAGVKLSLQTFSPKEYDKSLDNILNAVTGYVVYVENDIDTMFNSGNNVLVKLNFDGMNRVTIECYTQR